MQHTPSNFKEFRLDFKNAMLDLEEKYGIKVSLGNITYEPDLEFRVKMTCKNQSAIKAQPIIKQYTRADFSIGQQVIIQHKNANPSVKYVVTKINNKNIKLQDPNGKYVSCHPSFMRPYVN